MTQEKRNLVNLFRAFINEKPNLEFANYGNRNSYNSDYRQTVKAKSEALELLNLIENSDKEIDFELVKKSCERAYSGRLEIKKDENGYRLFYRAGQYYPLEYRWAAKAVLSEIWETIRDKSIQVPVKLTIADIKELNRRAGFYYFDKSAVSFFNSRIESTLLKGDYFIESIRFGNESKKYKLLHFNRETAEIDVIRYFKSKEEAKEHYKTLINA